ncbi:hypothetical protein RYZ20_10705 [Thioclava sp. A2]|uniref:hypothetical protein n=1 Tax=Thioclava sp. FCG-A2 TaxID=3080562 RepID=UPI002954E79F|nr:hypothetical protein [Thioclava sp. A2]MDV7271371.1 hypothetical protein [Thioclava sp. A2]
MRKFALILPALLVAACDPVIPNSGAGVGFGDYANYAAKREAELRGQQAAAQMPMSSEASAAQSAPMSALAPQPVTAPAPAATPEASLGADAMASLGLSAPAAPAPTGPVVTSGTAGPNLAAYALSTTHAPGTALYQRGGIHLISNEKACAKFISPDLAQMAFLEAGGPAKDSKNLDPDGDGFACGWDPRPFRAARN